MPVKGLVDSMLLLCLILCVMKETAIYSNAGSICKPNVRRYNWVSLQHRLTMFYEPKDTESWGIGGQEHEAITRMKNFTLNKSVRYWRILSEGRNIILLLSYKVKIFAVDLSNIVLIMHVFYIRSFLFTWGCN